MGRRHTHLAKRVRFAGKWRWVESCREKYLRTGYVGHSYDVRLAENVPYHLGLTDDATRVTCRSCIMLLAPHGALEVARSLERAALDGSHRIDTVVLLVTQEEVFKVRVPANEPSSERAELIAAAAARGRGAVATRTKRGH